MPASTAVMRRGIPAFFLIAFAAAGLSLGACSSSSEPDGGPLDADAGAVDGGQDGAAGDDGGGADGGLDGADGTPGDEGPDGDGGADAGADDGAEAFALELIAPPGWQRGPVRLRFTAFGPAGAEADVSLAWSADGTGFAPATALAGTLADARDLPLAPAGTAGRFVWDSKADLAGDQPEVWLRASLRVAGAVAASAEVGPFALHNDPDRTRLVVVPHPNATGPEGQAVPGDAASVLELAADGSLADTGLDVDCGAGPARAAFTADGRHLVVLGEGEGHNHHNLTSFAVAADGGLSPLGETIELYELGLSATDLQPALDGSGIWLVHYTGEGGLFFLSLADGLAELIPAGGGGQHRLDITLPSAMDWLPDGRHALVAGGALADEEPAYDALIVDLQSLTVVDRAAIGLVMLSEEVAVSPDGSRALMPSGDYGEQGRLWTVALDGPTIGAAQAIDLDDPPAKVAIHPAGGAALLTCWYPGSVLVLDLGYMPAAVVETYSGIGLADHIACVQEGELAGRCLVDSVSAATGVSALVPIQLQPDGSSQRGVDFAFGDGYDAMISGQAIQP